MVIGLICLLAEKMEGVASTAFGLPRLGCDRTPDWTVGSV